MQETMDYTRLLCCAKRPLQTGYDGAARSAALLHLRRFDSQSYSEPVTQPRHINMQSFPKESNYNYNIMNLFRYGAHLYDRANERARRASSDEKTYPSTSHDMSGNCSTGTALKSGRLRSSSWPWAYGQFSTVLGHPWGWWLWNQHSFVLKRTFASLTLRGLAGFRGPCCNAFPQLRSCTNPPLTAKHIQG